MEPLRRAWQEKLGGIDPLRFVFLDESGAKTNMTRRYGRGPRGQRVVEYAPQGHWQTTTMISALRLTGVDAPLVIDGPMDGVVFQGYVERILVPTLAPGDIVVMDNWAPHKAPAVRKAIEAAGAWLWLLPPYSPDFNPCEPLWSKVKQFLRSAAARTFDALIDAIGQALRTVTPSDCQGFFQGCGYDAT